jgi:hypothetical protein
VREEQKLHHVRMLAHCRHSMWMAFSVGVVSVCCVPCCRDKCSLKQLAGSIALVAAAGTMYAIRGPSFVKGLSTLPSSQLGRRTMRLANDADEGTVVAHADNLGLRLLLKDMLIQKSADQL